MRKTLGLMFALSFCTLSLAAEELIAETNAAFNASQQARKEGLKAFRTGDHALALAKMEEALTYRPGNALLLSYIAFLAAETGDTLQAEQAAQAYADTGLVPTKGIAEKLAEKLPTQQWQKLKGRFDTNQAPRGKSTVVGRVPAHIKLVEGIAYAPTGEIFVSSVVSGGIYTVTGNTAVAFVEANANDMGSFFGISYDPVRHSLFATYAHIDQTPDSGAGDKKTGVAEFNAETGSLKANWTLEGDAKQHQIADILITKNGVVYVSDAVGKAVYEINGANLKKAFDLSFTLSPQGLAELNGRLYLADYGRGIWYLDPETGDAHLLASPQNVSLVGIDGLTAHGGKLIAIQNGSSPHRILALSPNSKGTAITKTEIVAQALPTFDEPTLGTSTPDGYYFIAASQWPKYGKNGTLKEGQTAAPTTIVKLGY